jgi:cytoplasmic polyadenylation element-binding protein
VTYNYEFARDKFSSKPFQVIPWIVSDNVAIYKQQARLSNKLTVFVGALHGRLYAQALGRIFEELFHDVAYVQIDTDRYKYPIGSGRVTFCSVESYRRAVEENFLTIIAPKFSKRIQIEPYIEDEPCGKCKVISAPNFCKSRLCFDYFCDNCWGWHHSIEGLKNHVPVKRNRKIERY